MTTNQNPDLVTEARELAAYTDGLAVGLQSPTISRVSSSLRQLADEVERLRKQIKTMQREAREDAIDAAAEARWQERQGEDYGSY